MQLADHSRDSHTAMPRKIYAALVESMCQNFLPSFVGTICAATAALMSAIKTGNPWIWPCALAIIVVGTLRAIQMRKYERRKEPLTPEQAVELEPNYRIGVLLNSGALGLWCAVVILGSSDPVAHMLCVAVTIGYTAGGAARNYGRPPMVQLSIILACGPMLIALLVHGNFYYMVLGALLILFFIGLKQINLSLHSIFVNALVTGEREAALAAQFDTALNNMPNGLYMINADGFVSVVNRVFADMMKLNEDVVHGGATMRAIVSMAIAAKTLSQASADAIIAEVEASRAGEIVTLDTSEAGERALCWTFQPMAHGGTVVLVEDITERRNAEAKISRMARIDELTGLPNRISFRDEIERQLSVPPNPAAQSALLFIDLDQFKQVNDTLGHPCGDQLLCMVADRLREMLRADDFVARFGGDEFVVFQRGIKAHHDAAELARRIVEHLSKRYKIGNHQVEIGASVGIALTEPHVSADHLLKNADMALYRAKASGRGTFCFFRDEMAQTVEARRVLELDLREAFANEGFEIYYQPLVNLKSGRISTCEALLRWTHPVRGMVPPADIIPVVEDMGLIVDLGRWILRKACLECMKWPEAVSVAVNFSSQQFHQRDVLSEVRYALEVSGLPASRLEIEITESSLLRNTQWTHDVLAQLHAAGCRISLDDFGTGYSSLSYLNSFKFHKVKIDRSFLEGIDSNRPLTLLRGVARLSSDLGMSVVVEGVETNEQLELIGVEGTITEAQGYLFSRPVPAKRIRQLLDASHGRRLVEAQVSDAEPARSPA